ncbi:hypothetical protein [Actinomadura rupiterrae]|nr:hypothetical protein [Actinomadura rupiterrae]MCP2337546.1 hypothetical protein [Actinomadura rupiterrae]
MEDARLPVGDHHEPLSYLLVSQGGPSDFRADPIEDGDQVLM